MHKLTSTCCCRFRIRSLTNTVQTRRFTSPSSSSTSPSANPFPYPSNRNPTPHQIFHLSHSASENDIKARYFDLVRIYHPDKAGATVAPEIAHERFQAITTAYEILRGKKPYPAYRAARQRTQELYSGGAVDDRWKDRIFLGLAVATVGVFVLQTFTTRRDAIADAMINTRRPATYPSPRPEVEEAIRTPTEDEKRLSA